MYNRNVYIYWSKCGNNDKNFGDLITPYIYKKITGKNCIYGFSKNANEITYMGAGSIMKSCKQKNIVIWGSGIMRPTDKFNKPLKVLCVRGPLTRKRFLERGFDCPKIYGDLGLILPNFYYPQLKKIYKLGIIPHFVDYELCISLYKNDSNINIINVCNDVEKVVKEILQCEYTISSSLHGLIVSHAYEIKTAWIRFSNKIQGKNTKYWDYYKSIGILKDLKPIKIKKYIKPNKLINLIHKYENPNFPINTKHIIDLCPFS